MQRDPLLRRLQNRLLARLRAPEAKVFRAAAAGNGVGFAALPGHRYCLLVTYRRSGQPVATPVWFGLRGGNVYVRTGARMAKVRRVRGNPQVLVVPSTFRGRPLGPAVAGRARVLSRDEEATAERALRDNYGRSRQLYERLVDRGPDDAVYLEIRPERPGEAGLASAL